MNLIQIPLGETTGDYFFVRVSFLLMQTTVDPQHLQRLTLQKEYNFRYRM